MLYQDGTVSTTDGSHLVEGAGSQWIDNDIPAGSLIEFNDSGVWYVVARVLTRTTLLTATPVTGTLNGVTYRLVGDFTPVYGFPFPQRHDIDKSSIVSRSFVEVDATIADLHVLLDYFEFPPLSVPDLTSTPAVQSVAIISETGLTPLSLTVTPELDYTTLNQIALTLSPAGMAVTPSIPNLFISAVVLASNNTYTADTDVVTADGAIIGTPVVYYWKWEDGRVIRWDGTENYIRKVSL
jgi:hypothetical protein